MSPEGRSHRGLLKTTKGSARWVPAARWSRSLHAIKRGERCGMGAPVVSLDCCSPLGLRSRGCCDRGHTDRDREPGRPRRVRRRLEERRRWRRAWGCCIRVRWAPWWARACARAASASSGRRRAAARPAAGALGPRTCDDLGTLAAVVAAMRRDPFRVPAGLGGRDVARVVAAERFRAPLRGRECRRPGHRAPRGADRRRRGGPSWSTAASSARRLATRGRRGSTSPARGPGRSRACSRGAPSRPS